MNINARNGQESLSEKAEIFFDNKGLTVCMEIFFNREEINTIILNKYAAFEKSINKIVEEAKKDPELPKFILKRATIIAESAKGEADKYKEDVKITIRNRMYTLFAYMEKYISITDQVLLPYKAIFSGKDNEKFMSTFNEICDGVAREMLKEILKMICMPYGLPGNLAELLAVQNKVSRMSLEELDLILSQNNGDSKV